jgi:hypothetical protein
MTAQKIPYPVSEPTPDWEEVRQQDPVVHSIPVEVQGIVTAHDLPAKRSVMRTITVPGLGTAQPVEVVPGDPRIKNVWFFTVTGNASNVILGSREQANVIPIPDGFILTPNWIIGPLQGFEEGVYAISSTSANNLISVRYEFWAD